jgi:short-subunit dehydrogenase
MRFAAVPISYFTGRTVLITGASAGIGYEFARQLAPVARTIVLTARRNDRLEALKSELKVINPELELFSRPLDLRDKMSWNVSAIGWIKAIWPSIF